VLDLDLQTCGCPWGFTEGAKVGLAAHRATLFWGVQKGKAARESRQVCTWSWHWHMHSTWWETKAIWSSYLP